jgi:hypothetical protein
MTSRTHMQKGASQQLIEKRQGAKRGEPSRNGPGPVTPGQPACPVLSLVRDALCPVLLNKLPLPLPAAISIHSSESRQHEGEAPGGSRRPPQVLELPWRWPRPCPSHHGWPYVVKPWWSSRAHALIPSRQLYTRHSMVI